MTNDEAETVARAAAFTAHWHANDPAYIRHLVEARDGGQLTDFAIALGARVLQLADELYGDDAQAQLDGFAMDALWLAQESGPAGNGDRE